MRDAMLIGIGMVLGTAVFMLAVTFAQAECCGMFDVPFNTQLEIERQENYAHDQLRWEQQLRDTRNPLIPCGR